MRQVVKYITFFLLFPQFTYAQQNLPKIQSTKQDIFLKFNDDTIVWRLEPEKKLDVFYIGSTLQAKKTWFITDVDSIYFDVQAGKKYDFIIQYNNQNCYTRIVALNNPILLNRYGGFAIFFIVLFVLVFIFIKSASISYKKLFIFGIITPALFWIFTFIAGFIHGSYNHSKNAVSDLGEIGSSSEIVMAIFTFIIAICSMIFSVGFYKISKHKKLSVLPAILSFAMAISFLWAAIFPAGHQLHGTLGPLPAFIILGTLLLIFLWKNSEQNFSIKLWSGISALLMLLFVLRFIPTMQQQYEGAIQRTLYTGWSVWFVTLSLYFKKKLKGHEN